MAGKTQGISGDGFESGPTRPRRLFVHAGLHKTGTTALQRALAEGAPPGLLYPRTGRPAGLDGQHAIAWQLGDDPRFAAADGTIDALAEEIAGFDGDALISSEDFEGLLGDPARLRPLLRHERLRGHRATVLIGLRDQAGYAESLFMEMQHHGLEQDAGAFCDEILATGGLRFGAWRFVFDYGAVAQGLALAGIEAIFVPGGGTALLDAIGYGGAALPRLNQREPPLRSLARFCARRLGMAADPLHARLSGLMGGRLGDAAAVLSSRRRQAFAARFAAGNQRVAAAQGLAEACRGVAQPGHDMEALFSAAVAGAVAEWHQGRMADRAAREHIIRACSFGRGLDPGPAGH